MYFEDRFAGLDFSNIEDCRERLIKAIDSNSENVQVFATCDCGDPDCENNIDPDEIDGKMIVDQMTDEDVVEAINDLLSVITSNNIVH